MAVPEPAPNCGRPHCQSGWWGSADVCRCPLLQVSAGCGCQAIPADDRERHGVATTVAPRTGHLTGPRANRGISGSPARVPASRPCAATGPAPPLIGGQRGRSLGPLSALGGDPIPQRLVIDPQLGGHLADAAAAVEHQLRGALPALLGVFAATAHPGPPSSARAESGGVQPTGVTSTSRSAAGAPSTASPVCLQRIGAIAAALVLTSRDRAIG